MPSPAAQPRSRTERSADSRALILDAAVSCLVSDGYAGASTLAVQARAGVSRGRLLHHFPSREELLVAAASHLVNDMLTEAAEQAEHLDVPDPAERLDRCVELNWALFQKPPFWAAMELWNAARTDEALRAALRPEERRINTAIRAAADRIWGSAAMASPRYPVLRELLFTSMRGVAIAYSFEDRPAATDPHLRMWKDLAREML